MTNLPPPDRRSSPLGFDEIVAVIVAFAVIGTIFAVSLRQKGSRFVFKNTTPSLKTAPASPVATTSPTVVPTIQNRTTSQLEPNVQTTVTPAVPGTLANVQTTATSGLAGKLRISGGLPVTTALISPPSKSAKAGRNKLSLNKTTNFPDVPQVFWARPYIEALAARGIITGYQDGNFRPSQPVTRAEFAAIIQKAFDQKVVVPGQKYKDIADKFWASSAIQETTRSGFLRGYPDQAFRPDQTITKLEALIALSNGLGLTDKGEPNQLTKIFQDAKTIPKFAREVIAAATEYNLVVNYPNPKILNPNKPLTRAEAAALTYQAMVQAGKVPAITSEYLAKPQ